MTENISFRFGLHGNHQGVSEMDASHNIAKVKHFTNL